MFKRMTASLAVFLGAALVAAACSQQSVPSGSNQPQESEAALESQAAEQLQTASPALQQEEPTASPNTEAEVTPSPSEAPAAKLYKMDSVYRFKPLDEGATDKVVLLTFDDGPHNKEVLTSLLDTLDKHKAKAIFFVNGYRVKANPDLLTLIHERGQTIGNHSWDHINLKKESAAKVEQQVADVQDTVKELTGEAPKFFRPPYGSGNDSVKEIVKNHGMLYMTWSNGSLDWEQKSPGDPDKVVASVLEQLHPGANILMHELAWTAEALDKLLTQLEDKGYGFIDPAAIDTKQSN
ncbi:Peptidoglycan/xylan/chitin deacetylase, PgdA/CDA1 family [Paenibacillus algorifonticola]|uniref:Peptidoglycan/xylan/chitin deacetylase, PgdA/CDA1 family n=1 Tax=Paenibacillus algorifonticola TaxID=684063 RepID=A0A1I2EGP1_9BACL|nr:polysaccharide deacetylase family protein [Paenibacillus algorifonticola]SFE91909.1 Peptidoglycan/xylan/chitin deacetylase, PgdA/CDA1 family [Paenibacillus algorifonticola]